MRPITTSLADVFMQGLPSGPVQLHQDYTNPLEMGPQAAPEVASRLQASLAEIQQQTVYYTYDSGRGQTAVFNTLRGRGRRAVRPKYEPPAPPASFMAGGLWHAANPDPQISEPFGVVRSERVLVRANFARSGVASAIIFAADKADHLALTADDFAEFGALAWDYMRACQRYNRAIVYWAFFCNGGARSAGSLPWAHCQVVGSPVPFGLAARLAVAPMTYFSSLLTQHESAGLVVPVSSSFVALADLVPAKERGVLAASDSLADGARQLRRYVDYLIEHEGLTSYSVGALLCPSLFGAAPLVDGLPPCLWRFADRGDAADTIADFGCLEALFSTTVVATDPTDVARSLRAAYGLC